MTHSIKDYKFETESEAIAFAAAQRENKCPSEDKYVRGTVYMNEDEIFKNMLWASTGKKWWQVTIEYFR
jgi:hypothetical protein